jgi:hypothetical protein
MSPILARSWIRRRRTSDDLLHLGEVLLRFGMEACGQWWTIVGRSWRHEVDHLVRGTMESVPSAELLRGMAGSHCAVDRRASGDGIDATVAGVLGALHLR